MYGVRIMKYYSMHSNVHQRFLKLEISLIGDGFSTDRLKVG